MTRTRTWLPDLPPAFVEAYNRQQQDHGAGILGAASGGILDAVQPPSAEERRHQQYAIYWAFWSAHEHWH